MRQYMLKILYQQPKEEALLLSGRGWDQVRNIRQALHKPHQVVYLS